jgi:hypothetical protein
MATRDRSPALPGSVSNLLDQISRHGTPFRIDGATETYYVLSADQLRTLLRGIIEDVESAESFTPQDFGLTEADLSTYEARRQARREQIDLGLLTPLEAALEQRLRQWTQAQHQQPLSEQEKREVEQLLHELETAIGSNVRSMAKKTQ